MAMKIQVEVLWVLMPMWYDITLHCVNSNCRKK